MDLEGSTCQGSVRRPSRYDSGDRQTNHGTDCTKPHICSHNACTSANPQTVLKKKKTDRNQKGAPRWLVITPGFREEMSKEGERAVSNVLLRSSTATSCDAWARNICLDFVGVLAARFSNKIYQSNSIM